MRSDVDRKRTLEDKVSDPYVETAFLKHISREVDLLVIVLLAGALGSFLHAARSFTEFLGNERLRSSWAWWYCLAPFTGSVLALIFYAAVRGGFLVINAGSTNKTPDLNAYGIASVAAIVGMFSKEATTKLGDLFKTLFQSEKSKEAKDPLTEPKKTQASGAESPAGSATGSAGTPAQPANP